MQKSEEKPTKYIECIHCKRFFSCKIKENKPEQCLNFEERNRENGREEN